MKLARLVTLAALMAVVLFPQPGAAQTFPVVAGTWEVQGGFNGTVLPEGYSPLWSAQVEARAGMFIAEGLEIQAIGDVRVWPLGAEAPKSYGITGNLLWFPRTGETRNLYLLGGGGGFFRDQATPTQPESGFQPMLRTAVGTKIKMPGQGAVRNLHLTTEFRGDFWFEEQTSFVAGFAIGLSWFTGQA
jgi:hypothetical protein